MATKTLNKPVKLFKAGKNNNALLNTKVDREGGDFGAGVIYGFAVITESVEALGHEAWVDSEFVGQVASQLQGSAKGIKSRFTHPGMSADALTLGLGRVKFSKMSNGVLRGDLHFWKSAANSPDGNLSGFLMDKAEEAPSSFGSSIAFNVDMDAMAEFAEQHEDAYGVFKSPDPNNTENYYHVRLDELRYVDIVDSPAANPSGLFHQDEVFTEADQLLEYALGLTDTKPEKSDIGVDPDRLRGFTKRFLSNRGIEMKLNLSKVTPTQDVPEDEAFEAATAEEATDVLETTEPDAVGDAEAGEEAEAPEAAEPVAEADDDGAAEAGDAKSEDAGHFPQNNVEEEPSEGGHFSIEDLDRYIETFGESAGLKYFRSQTPFSEAQTEYIGQLKKENQKLATELDVAKSCDEGVSGQLTGRKDKGKGFASKINVK